MTRVIILVSTFGFVMLAIKGYVHDAIEWVS